MSYELPIKSVVTIFIIAVLIGALTPALSKIDAWSGFTFFVAAIFVIAGIILSFFRDR